MNKNLKLISLMSIVCLAFALGFVAAPNFAAHKNPSVQWNMYAFSEGIMIGEGSGNLITDLGEVWLRDWAGSSEANTTSRNGTRYISLSNVGSPAAGWTELDTEVAANGFARAEGTVTWWENSGDSAYNVTKTFTASDTQQLQTAGLQWSGQGISDANLFAAATFTQTTFNNGDTLTITWTITFDAN